MGASLKVRIIKTLLSILIVPVLMIVMFIIGVLVVFLPIFVFIWPSALKVKGVSWLN